MTMVNPMVGFPEIRSVSRGKIVLLVLYAMAVVWEVAIQAKQVVSKTKARIGNCMRDDDLQNRVAMWLLGKSTVGGNKESHTGCAKNWLNTELGYETFNRKWTYARNWITDAFCKQQKYH